MAQLVLVVVHGLDNPRPSFYPLLGPKYPLLGTIYPNLRAQGRSWIRGISYYRPMLGACRSIGGG